MNYQGASVFTNQPVEITVQSDKIAAIKSFESSSGLPYIAPGFLDIVLFLVSKIISGSNWLLMNSWRG